MLQLFIQSLEELNQVHDQLSEVSLEKREVLIKGDIDRLSDLVKQESQLLRKIGKLEEERMFQISEYGNKQGLNPEGMTLQELLQSIPDQADRDKVDTLTSNLQGTLMELREQNDLNMRLTQDSLQYINEFIEVMTHIEKEKVNYESPQNKKDGKGNSSDGQRFFDAKA